jgi:hypothetical protein
MTGRTNLDGIKEERVNRFVTKGIHPDNNQRYQNFDELKRPLERPSYRYK